MKPDRGIPINKPIDSGEFVYGWYCENEGLHYIIPDTASTFNARINPEDLTSEHFVLEGLVEVHPKSVGQQIGIQAAKSYRKGENGKEIFEGDKIKQLNPLNGDVYIGEVKSKRDGRYYIDLPHHVPSIDEKRCEIIGTIHETENQNGKEREANSSSVDE